MKNYFVAILGALFLLTLAGSSFAVVAEIPSETQAVNTKGDSKITISGELEVRGWDTKNIGNGSGPGGAAPSQKSTTQSASSPTGK